MSNREKRYDAFLNYSYSDIESVELIAQKISDLGGNIWFDKWSMVAGVNWRLSLERALDNSNAILVFIGPNSISPRQRLELYAGLDRKKKIIPILLPGSNWDDVPSPLKEIQCIDLRQSDFDSAREKFEKAMELRQQIGDRAGEASTWHHFGFIAWHHGKIEVGLRLIALGYQIFASIGHSDANVAFMNLCAAASQVSLSQEQLDALQKEVTQSYERDSGRSLIQAAFPEA